MVEISPEKYMEHFVLNLNPFAEVLAEQGTKRYSLLEQTGDCAAETLLG